MVLATTPLAPAIAGPYVAEFKQDQVDLFSQQPPPRPIRTARTGRAGCVEDRTVGWRGHDGATEPEVKWS